MKDPSRHADSRNALESLLRKIPGFRGYLEKEYRRESDDLVRSQMASQLQKGKASLDAFQKSLVTAGRLDALAPYESIRNRLQLLQSRIQGAMRGYSGFFDFVRVDESVLDQVYQLDLGLVDEIQILLTALDQLSANPSEADRTRLQIEQQITSISNQIDERTKLLEGLN